MFTVFALHRYFVFFNMNSGVINNKLKDSFLVPYYYLNFNNLLLAFLTQFTLHSECCQFDIKKVLQQDKL